jgi:hypothetical protein
MSGEVIEMKLRLFSIVPVLAALTSGCSPSFEADLPDVEITQHGLKMAGVPGAALVGDASVTSSFTFSSSAWAKHMNSEVLVHKVTITASNGLPNLDFIKDARVTAAAPAISEGATDLVNYERSQDAPSSATIEVTMPAPVDITSLWSAGQVVVELQVAGQLPEQDWTVDVTVQVSGNITYKL